MTKLRRALALVGAGALVVGVAVAFAGVPHLSIATGDVSAGTTCTTKKCTTTTSTSLAKTADLAAAAAPSSGTPIPASVQVTWTGSQMNKTDSVTTRFVALAKWACFNGGSNIPSDNNNPKTAQNVDIDEPLADHPSKNGNTSGSFTIDITPAAGELALQCQGTQVIALYSLRLKTVAEGGVAFEVTATSDQGSSSVPVSFANTFPGHPEWLYCRDGNTAACFS